MIWTKRAAVAVVLVGAMLGGCSSSEQLLGSDGSSVSSGGGGGGGENLVDNVRVGSGSCLLHSLAFDATGNPDCTIALARHTKECNCDTPGLGRSGLGVFNAKVLASNSVCGDPIGSPCNEWCVCSVAPATGEALTQCRESAEPSTETAGWCFVSASQGEAEAALVSDCSPPINGKLRTVGAAQLRDDDVLLISCAGASAPTIPPRAPAALGALCVPDDEWAAGFSGYEVNEVNVQDHAPQCDTGICLSNHFQGRVSCPYGQAAGAGECLLPDRSATVTREVKPQLEARQASVASICSCQCDGYGPGPYCTCPDSMQCEHLVDDLQLGESQLAGSYCIPKGSQYDASQLSSVCVEPNCGPAHP